MSALAFCPLWPFVRFVNCPPALCVVFIVGLNPANLFPLSPFTFCSNKGRGRKRGLAKTFRRGGVAKKVKVCLIRGGGEDISLVAKKIFGRYAPATPVLK